MEGLSPSEGDLGGGALWENFLALKSNYIGLTIQEEIVTGIYWNTSLVAHDFFPMFIQSIFSIYYIVTSLKSTGVWKMWFIN